MLLKDIFHIYNGLASSKVDINESKSDYYDIAYMRPSQSWNNVVAGYINRASINSKFVFPPDTIFVSTDGDGSHTYCHVSPIEFVPNSNVSVLVPKKEMNLKEKIFYSMCISKNRYKFSYGRKPKGQRLANIELPNQIFESANKIEIENLIFDFSSTESQNIIYNQLVQIGELFDVRYGTNLELNALEEVGKKDMHTVNFVSRTSRNNGISAIVKRIDNIEPISGGVLTVAGGGSVLETFYQDEPFYSGRDLYYLIPKRVMTVAEKLFYCMIIRANKYRYNYGRQANRTLKTLKIPNEIPNWVNEEKIIQFIQLIEN
jgi:Type I restriction modification DNA specificity domain